jgi:hypothetical protein
MKKVLLRAICILRFLLGGLMMLVAIFFAGSQIAVMLGFDKSSKMAEFMTPLSPAIKAWEFFMAAVFLWIAWAFTYAGMKKNHWPE